MREIKFRAWHATQLKMYSPEEMAADQLTLLTTGQFINVNSSDARLSEIYTAGKMMPLQYTGLNDASGAEIYEGDIVQFTYWWFDGNEAESLLSGSIVYQHYCMSYALEGIKNAEWLRHTGATGSDTESFAFFNFDEADFTVIGNIYENPELLEAAL